MALFNCIHSKLSAVHENSDGRCEGSSISGVVKMWFSCEWEMGFSAFLIERIVIPVYYTIMAAPNQMNGRIFFYKQIILRLLINCMCSTSACTTSSENAYNFPRNIKIWFCPLDRIDLIWPEKSVWLRASLHSHRHGIIWLSPPHIFANSLKSNQTSLCIVWHPCSCNRYCLHALEFEHSAIILMLTLSEPSSIRIIPKTYPLNVA